MADEPAATQEGKRLKIRTVLDTDPDERKLKGDPLLMVGLSGVEGFSIPYSYTVTLWRARDKPYIDPRDLINTPATILVKIDKIVETEVFNPGDHSTTFHADPDEVAYVRRCGVIETFQYDGFAKLEDQSTKISLVDVLFDQYTATIVPAFKMLDLETAYRVFEDKDVKEIIEQVVNSFPNLAVNYDRLNSPGFPFPKMEYCVQFAETSFNFLSRLMAEFGIWYFFEHDKNIGVATMALGKGHPKFDPVHLTDGKIFPVDKMTITLRAESATTISGWKQTYSPVSRWARRGNFNPLIPTSPFTGAFAVLERNDMIEPTPHRGGPKGPRTPPDDTDRFRNEGFGAYHFDTNDDARLTAERYMQGKEPLVEMTHGQTRNSAFIPGYQFDIIETPLSEDTRQQQLLDQEAQLTAGSPDVLVFRNRTPTPAGKVLEFVCNNTHGTQSVRNWISSRGKEFF